MITQSFLYIPLTSDFARLCLKPALLSPPPNHLCLRGHSGNKPNLMVLCPALEMDQISRHSEERVILQSIS